MGQHRLAGQTGLAPWPLPRRLEITDDGRGGRGIGQVMPRWSGHKFARSRRTQPTRCGVLGGGGGGVPMSLGDDNRAATGGLFYSKILFHLYAWCCFMGTKNLQIPCVSIHEVNPFDAHTRLPYL